MSIESINVEASRTDNSFQLLISKRNSNKMMLNLIIWDFFAVKQHDLFSQIEIFSIFKFGLIDMN